MNSAIAGDRQHYWDTLRALLMLLGIPYHVALSYRPGQTWIVRSDEGWAPFVQLAEFIHLFRMPAFFLIAGFFAALLLSRRAPGVWLKQRFMRLRNRQSGRRPDTRRNRDEIEARKRLGSASLTGICVIPVTITIKSRKAGPYIHVNRAMGVGLLLEAVPSLLPKASPCQTKP